MTKTWVAAAICLLVLVGSNSVGWAGNIKGYVLDNADGQPLANVSIRLEKPARSTTTDERGYFQFNQLEPGDYAVSVSALGYAPQSQHITLDASHLPTLTIRLAAIQVDLPEINVRGFLANGTDFTARYLEQSAPHLMTVVTAETIEKSSDVTVADVTQRISGLSVLRDNTGQATRTIIRGADPRYNYTLVNGIKVPSPDDRSRYIPLDMFPADLVQRVEVYKSLTAAQESDAIGGAINIVLREAPTNPALKLKLATGYHQSFFTKPYTGFDASVVQSKSPYETYGPAYYASENDFSRANLAFRQRQPLPHLLSNLVWSRRFVQQRLGVLITTDYQRISRGSTSSFIPLASEPQLNNVPSLTDYYVRDFSTTLTRKSLHTNIDYTLGQRHKLNLYQFWMSQQQEETRFSVDTSLSQGRTIPGTGRISLLQRSRLHNQSIYAIVGQGRHLFGNPWKLNWSGSYSTARGAYPDWAELTASTGRLESPAERTIVSTPVLLAPLSRTWLSNTEQEASVYADIHYQPAILQKRLSLQAGGLYRQKNRRNFFNTYSFRPAITSAEGQLFGDIYSAQWVDHGPINPLGAVASPNTYTAIEAIGAAYASTHFSLNQFDLTTGLRLETTHQRFTSSIDPRTSIGKTTSIQYADWLPSVTVRVDLSGVDKLRFSYFGSLSRPALYDVTFYSLQYEDYVEAGNPFLKRARARNVDVKYERYLSKSDFWQVGAFYKYIVDPYERALLNASDPLFPIPDQGLPYTPAGQLTAQLRNFAPATLLGAEASLARSVGRFVLTANYTYTHSAITHDKKVKTRETPTDPGSNILTVTRPEVRPLQGQSPHLANVSLAYAHSGIKGQISAVYTGQRIYAVSGWYGLDYWQRGYTQLDLSAEKKLGNHCLLFIKVNNLLNATTSVDLRQANTGFGKKLLPGQESAQFITVLKQYDKTMYYAGIQLGW